jgi:hypothetical protein
MCAQTTTISTWRELAETLAQRARELRALWQGLGHSPAAADARAQGAICAMLASRLARGSEHLTPPFQPDQNTRAIPPAVTGVLRRACKSLCHVDLRALLANLNDRDPGADPITRFYECFLAAYDPRERMRRGVFYTPRPVAGFIVRAVHESLQQHLGLSDGLAHAGPGTDLRIVDPAAGTGVFLVEVIDLIHRTLGDRWRAAGHSGPAISRLWREYVARSLPGRLIGFELMPAAAALANVNVALKLRATGFRGTEANGWVRTGNSLELLAGQPPAGAVTVIVGNPPYAIRSGRSHSGLSALLADYKRGLGETNVNALSDDYVKFFRLAHAMVVAAGAGVIGFVTNNSLLEGATHRQMRALLLRDFDQVQVVDLHGSVMRRREVPAGLSDESVFEIRQGVAITILARTPEGRGAGRREHRGGHVRRADLWGTRRHKFEQLSAGPQSLTWQEPPVSGPYFFFRSAAGDHDGEYRRWPSLAEIFGVFASGIKFRKDGLLVKHHFSRAGVEEMLRDVAELPVRALTAKYGFRETADWRLKDKRALFADWRSQDIVAVTYRPFDVRYAFYPLDRAGRIIVRGDSRVELMRHVLTVPNIGLSFNRQVVGDRVTHFLVSRRPVSHGIFYLGNKGQDYFAPLYLADGGQRRSNLTPVMAAPSPESALHYLYAVVHSPTYRARYAEPLKLDFPRVPPPGSASLFAGLGRLGADLVGLHLLEDAYPAASWVQMGGPSPLDGKEPMLSGDGPPAVAPGYPKRCHGRVYLHPGCWFEAVPDVVWWFEVGGYPVCAKWLKDRRGRELSPGDVRHYGRVVRALARTIGLMSEIDEVIAAHGGWPSAFGGG